LNSGFDLRQFCEYSDLARIRRMAAGGLRRGNPSTLQGFNRFRANDAVRDQSSRTLKRHDGHFCACAEYAVGFDRGAGSVQLILEGDNFRAA
jgi:hypothetical protein